MPDGTYTDLLEKLTLALHNARTTGTEQYVWQLPGGEWETFGIQPAESIYLRVRPDGGVSAWCDSCERACQQMER